MNDNPVPPPEVGELPDWVDTSKAQAEVNNFADEGALKGQRDKNDLLWLKIYGWVVVALMIVFVLLFISSLSSWAWHYVTPVSWHWLTEEQLSKIQSVIFSGSLGGIVSFIAQRQLAK